MDQFLEWVQSNWGETSVIGTWIAIIARLIWKRAGTWRNAVRRWFRARGSTNTLGLTKHRDDDDHVVVSWSFMGKSFNIHKSGKYVDLSEFERHDLDQPTNDDESPTDKPQ